LKRNYQKLESDEEVPPLTLEKVKLTQKKKSNYLKISHALETNLVE